MGSEEVHFVLNTVAASGLNLGTAHLYVEQIPKGLFAVTEIC